MSVHAATAAPARPKLDLERIRADFPILGQRMHGRPLVYLDNAATSQKPRSVIESIARYYSAENANIHRGLYALSEASTAAYEAARAKAQRFVNAADCREIVFVRNTTEAINLVAQSFARPRLLPGDEIVLSTMEHHSNIVPWQLVCEQTGAVLRIVPITDSGEIELDAYAGLLGPKTRLVTVVHVSNALGTINPIKAMVAMARERGVPVLVDGAQAAPHMPIDVQNLDCDFYAFSGHKMFGPTGIGVLFAKRSLLDAMPPYQGGGEMIQSVTFERTTYAAAPAKFEAGTPSIAGAIGLGAAIDYLDSLDWNAVHEHEAGILAYATEGLAGIPGVRLIGTAPEKVSVVSFVIDGVHAHDVGTILDQDGVAVRTGHHCSQPVMERMRVPATVRASFAFYNTRSEVDALLAAVEQVRVVFG
jgi:cysteine desulfurase/selenocysteine lyase